MSLVDGENEEINKINRKIIENRGININEEINNIAYNFDDYDMIKLRKYWGSDRNKKIKDIINKMYNRYKNYKKYDLIFNLEEHIKAHVRNEVKRGTIRDDIFNNPNKNDGVQTLRSILKYDYQYFIDDFHIIKFVINKSPYVLAHKTVDSVIRTLRNAFGNDNRRLADFNLMRQMVNYYNNTPHSSLRFKNFEYNFIDEYDKESRLVKPSKYIYYTPSQMQHDIELEWKYIRKMKMKLRDITEKQSLKGLLTYKPGNILLAHIDKEKITKKHEKRRRVFNELVKFIKYSNGNVVCELLKPYRSYNVEDKTLKLKDSQPLSQVIEVPIIFTKFVCSDISKLDNNYKVYFNVNDNVNT